MGLNIRNSSISKEALVEIVEKVGDSDLTEVRLKTFHGWMVKWAAALFLDLLNIILAKQFPELLYFCWSQVKSRMFHILAVLSTICVRIWLSLFFWPYNVFELTCHALLQPLDLDLWRCSRKFASSSQTQKLTIYEGTASSQTKRNNMSKPEIKFYTGVYALSKSYPGQVSKAAS